MFSAYHKRGQACWIVAQLSAANWPSWCRRETLRRFSFLLKQYKRIQSINLCGGRSCVPANSPLNSSYNMAACPLQYSYRRCHPREVYRSPFFCHPPLSTAILISIRLASEKGRLSGSALEKPKEWCKQEESLL